jgi:hypothetical protein
MMIVNLMLILSLKNIRTATYDNKLTSHKQRECFVISISHIIDELQCICFKGLQWLFISISAIKVDSMYILIELLNCCKIRLLCSFSKVALNRGIELLMKLIHVIWIHSDLVHTSMIKTVSLISYRNCSLYNSYPFVCMMYMLCK